ncbi:SCP-like extracellular protein [Virgibacillus sp. MSP4-1]|nr:SCP-like extracellular protein [Virgibacillus sp. MSP4-1]
MKKRIYIISFISILFLLLAACNTQDNALNNGNNDDNISSIATDSSSKDYPHTMPIRIQDAKYEFKRVEMRQQHSDGQQQRKDNQQTEEKQQQQQQDNQQTQQQNQNIPQQNQNNQQQNQQNQANEQNNTNQAQQSGDIKEFESRVIELTNQERKNQGLPELKADANLSQVARKKSADMQTKGYFSHTSPTYGSPFDMMRDFGIDYQTAGENIAKGQSSPEQVVESWMNSQGHRENILSNKFTHIGVGYIENGHYWTQMFISK